MTQIAFVSRIVDDRHAEVLVQRSTACGGNCVSCGGACAANSRLYVVAVNRARASVGEKVRIASGTAGILSVAALVYLFPLVLLFLGYAASAMLRLTEPLSIVVSLLSFAAGVALVVLLGRRRRPITFEIVERL